MADKIQLDGKTYLPIAEAASVTGITEQQVRLLAGQGRVLLRAIGKKIYADFDGLQTALREAPNPSVGAPIAPPAPIVQAPAGVKIVVPTPLVAPVASSKPQVSGADAAAIREKFASIDTSTVSLPKVSVMPRGAGSSDASALRPTVVPAILVSPTPENVLAPIVPIAPMAVTSVPIKSAPAPIAAPSPNPGSLEAALMPEIQKIAPTANIPSAIPTPSIAPQVEQKIPDTLRPTSPAAPATQTASVQTKAPIVEPAVPAHAPSKEAMHSAATHMSSAELSAMGSITQSNVPVPSPLRGVKVPPQPLQSNIARSLSTTAAALAAFVFVIGTGIAAYEKSPQAVAFLASAGKQVAAVFSADPTVTYTSSNAPSGAIVADGSPSSNQALATAATIPGGTGTSTQPIYYVYNYPVIERVVQEVKYINADTPADWNAQLDALYQRIQSQIQGLNITTNTQFAQQYQVIAQTNNIDKLGSVTIDNNSIFSGGTITGSTLTDIASLDVDGDTNLAGLTVGDITASGSGAFSGSGTFSYIVASSTNATSTFNGALLAARAPTVAHTFAAWTTGASNSAWWDAALVVNPASATGDSNLISAAVNGSVKFLVDAEGDVFVNNLTSVGSVTLSTTSASSFNVEGNTVLGDSISDTTTINGTLIVTGTTTASTVSGKFGVGTTTPWGRLSVLAADNASDPQFVVASSSAIGLILNKSGYFGIGTSSPTNKLEVSGNTFLGGNLTVTGTTNFSGGTIFSGLASFNLASTSQLSVFQKAYFGATATSTFDSAGNLSVAGTLDVSGNTTLVNATSSAFYAGTASSTNLFSTSLTAGTATFGRATTTNLFSTTASSTNLYSTNASFGVLTAGTLNLTSTLGVSGLATFANGFVSQASSTVAGAFTTTGTNTFGGALNIAGAITSTALSANTFPYASTTALSVSGTGYFPGSGIWNSSGSLGVGTTSPQTLAHIWKSGGDTSALLRIEEYGATGDSAIQFRVENASSWFTGIDNSDSNSFKIGTGALGSADKFTITTTGNVGVGTTSPFRLFSVAGASQFDSTASFGSSGSSFGVDQGGSIELKGTSGSSQPYFDIGQTAYDYDFRYQLTPSSNVLSISASSTANILNIVGGGKVGVGATSPFSKLEISGDAGASWLNSALSITNTGTGAKRFALSARSDSTFNISDESAGSIRLTVGSTGNVGIGTTSPYRKLSVTDTVAAAQASIAYDGTRDTQLQTDSSGDFVLNPSGDDVRINDDNLWVCAGGSCPSGTPSGNGNLVVETKIGVGVSNPSTKLHLYDTTATGLTVESNGTDTDAYLNFLLTGSTNWAIGADDSDNDNFKISQNSTLGSNDFLTITQAGRVGVGTTSPAQQLGVAGMLFVGANGATGMGTATSTFYGDIKIIGKLDVSTIDPVYTIDGVKWATYGHSTVGIKEEAVLKVVPTQWDSAKNMYAYTIDFNAVEKGSDLWLFYQVTDFGKDWSSLVTTLAPAFDGRTYYEENPGTKTLTIYASESAPVSVRLIANRYDFTKWGNLRPDQDGDTAGTHVIESKPVSGSND